MVDTPSKTVGPSTREKGNEENASLLIVKVKSFGMEINMARWSKQKDDDVEKIIFMSGEFCFPKFFVLVFLINEL